MSGTCGLHPGAENHCASGACGSCWLCKAGGSVAVLAGTDGPYCSRCGIHRVQIPGSECVVCLDSKGRP